jgi:NADH dehydrogenase [ubiquinone] 1 alpha subcomplex assembly factor 5
MHGEADGSVPATFQVIYMVCRAPPRHAHTLMFVTQIGWKPGPNQPQALARGSGNTNLKEVL